MSVGKPTVVVVLVGVGHLLEDGQDLLVGRSVLDGVAHRDGRGVARQRSWETTKKYM